MFKSLFNSKKPDYRNWSLKDDGLYWHNSVKGIPLFARSKTLPTDEERAVMRLAIDLISQTPTGRYLLKKSKKSLKSIDFIRKDPNLKVRGNESFMSLGHMQRNKFNDVEIYLLSPHNYSDFKPEHIYEAALETATVLIHELAHCVQFQHSRVYRSHAYTPLSYITLSLATEADAYAHEQQFARELFAKDPKGPENQHTTFSAAIKLMVKNRYYASYQSEEIDSEKLYDGTLMAEAFLHFYTHNGLRNHYTKQYTAHLPSLLDAVEKSNNKMLRATAMRLPVPDFVMRHFIQHKGKSYLKRHLPDLDMHGNPLFCAADISLKDMISNIYQRRGQLLSSSKEIEDMLSDEDLFIDFSKDGFVSNPENPLEVTFKKGIANDNKQGAKPAKNHVRP
tara:strand:+ start:1388 stop:2566 length:1179 start_codon:yes stop_codon:yes gene_type:complete